MQIDAFLGNTDAVASLKSALQAGTLPHAVLLAGPDGCGRNFAARCLVADALFPAGGPGADAVMRGESPEVLLLQGEGRAGQIPVERVREVRYDVFRSSLSAAGRAVLVRDAHNMAAPAANALLKVLEEPPDDVLFVLTARDASSLPATIQSRCALYPLAPVSQLACAQALAKQMPSGTDPDFPALLAAVYGGRIGLGLKALEEERQDTLRDALRAVLAAEKGDAYVLLSIFSRYEGRSDDDREKRDAFLADCEGALSACLHTAHAQTVRGLPPVAPKRVLQLLPPITDARLALRANAAPKVTFAALALRLAG